MNRWDIPEDDLKKLYSLMGEKEAKSFLDSSQNNYLAVKRKIIELRIIRFSQVNEKAIYWALAIIGFLLVFIYFISLERGIGIER